MNIKALSRHFAVLAFAMLTTVQASAYDFEVDGIYYDVISIEDLTAAVTHGDNEYTGDVEIPSTVVFKGRTFDVAAIGSNAFDECSSLKSVEIPNSVTSIGEYAFAECTSLASVVIPNGVTSIGESAFYYCTSLASVVIPNGVKYIGKATFMDCTALESIGIPNSVTSIGESAFEGCTTLETVETPNSVKQIGLRAFFNCTSLSSFTLSGGVTEWDVSSEHSNNGNIGWGIFLHTEGYSVVEGSSNNIEKLHISDSEEPLFIDGFLISTYVYSYEFYKLPLEELYIGREIYNTNRPYDDIFPSPEKLELGGNLKNDDIYVKFSSLYGFGHVKTIIYGEHIEKISYPCEAATAIYLRSATPPVTVEWSNYNYINAVLYVPQGSLAAYQSADVWKNFWEIREWDATTGVESPLAGNKPEVSVSGRQITVSTGGQGVRVRVYNAAGSQLYDGGEGTVSVAAPGLYIVRAGNHSEKLLVK